MSFEENLKSYNATADASLGIYTGVPGQPGSAVPNGAKQYHAVCITGAKQVGLNTTKAGTADGVTHSTNVFDSATAAYTQADVGRPISATGIPAGTTIADIISATSVHLSQAASASATGLTVTYGLAPTVGVLQNKPQRAGMGATVGHIGITKAVAGGVISAGQEVVPNSAGRFVPGVAAGPGLRFLAQGVAAGDGEIVALQIV